MFRVTDIYVSSPERLHKYYVTRAYGFSSEAMVPRGLNFFC